MSAGDEQDKRGRIPCRICGRWLVSVNVMHLRRHEELDRAHPVLDYKRLFGLRVACSKWMCEQMTRSLMRRYRRTGQRWSKRRVLREIRRRKRLGLPLNVQVVRFDRGAGSLSTMAWHHFGSWDNALAAAGIRPEAVRRIGRWDRARVVNEITARAASGRRLDQTAVRADRFPLLSAGRRWFGDWNRALKAAGLDPAKHRKLKRWNREEVIRALRRRQREGKSLEAWQVKREDGRLLTAVRRYLGRWEDAMAAISIHYIRGNSRARPVLKPMARRRRQGAGRSAKRASNGG